MPTPTPKAYGAETVGTTSASVPWPSHVEGDLALLMVESNWGTVGPVAITLTSAEGFVEVTGSPVQSTGVGALAGTQAAMFWCRATSSAMVAPQVAAGDHITARIITFAKVKTTGSPFNLILTGSDGASTSHSLAGGTTTTDKCLAVLLHTTQTDGGSLPFSSAEANVDLTGVAEISDFRTDTGGGGGQAVIVGTKETAGAFGTTSWTTAASTRSTQIMVLLEGSIIPVISNVSPDQGDLTDSREEGRNTPVTFTYLKGRSEAEVCVYARMGSDVYLVYGPNASVDGVTGFSPMFSVNSVVEETDADTYDFSVIPNGGWWGDPVVTAGDFFEVEVTPSQTPGDFGVTREEDRLTEVTFTHTRSTSGTDPCTYIGIGSDVYLVYGENGTVIATVGFSPMFADRSTVVDNEDDTFDFVLLPGGGWWANPVLTTGDFIEATVVESEDQ